MNYFDLFNNIPPQLATMLIAMTPIGENRASVPIALTVYNMPVWQALFWSILGSILAATIIIFFLDTARQFMIKKLNFADKFFSWLDTRTERKFIEKYEKWGEIALILFVAVPLPITGAWTGSLAAVLFGIKPVRALLFISIGVILSAVIVALMTLGVINLI